MLLKNNEHNYIFSLISVDKKKTEELLENIESPELIEKLQEDLKMAKSMLLNLMPSRSINFENEENLLAKKYLFIKQYEGKEYYWLLDCKGYTRDIAAAGTFSEDEANHYFKGLKLSLLDLINGKSSGKEGYAVTVADYISYQKALIK